MDFIDDENIYFFDNTPLLETEIDSSILNIIKSQENLYLKKVEDISTISSCFNKNDKEVVTLKDLYKNKFVSKRWEGHYDKIRNSINECPYCGFGEITEIDHFLAKSLYPEFILFYYNLIPSCNNCNKQKGIKSIHIHPYKDKIDIEPFDVETKISNSNIVFLYNVNNDISDNLKEYIRLFDLSKRYSKQVNSKFNNDIYYYKHFDYKLFEIEIQIRYKSSIKIYLKAFYKSILDNLQMVYNYIHNK